MAERYRIDPMSAASPDMGILDLTALRENIAKLGQLVPIAIWRGRVIDGRKRLACCEALGIEPKIVTIADEATATDYAVALNLLRTQYTEGQRAMYAAKLVTLANGTNQHAHKVGVHLSTPADVPVVSRAEAAKLVGILPVRVSEARRVKREASPEVTEAVEAGIVSLGSAVRICQTVPRAQQAGVIAKARGAKQGGKKLPPGTIAMTSTFRATPKRDPAMVIEKALHNALTQCEVLAEYQTQLKGDVREEWGTLLDGILNILRRFARRMKKEGGNESRACAGDR